MAATVLAGYYARSVSGRAHVAIEQSVRSDAIYAVASGATRAAAVTMLQIGLALMLIATVSDAAFAVIDGGSATAVIVGLGFAALAGAGVVHPEQAASLLTPRGRVVFCAALFAVAGMLDWGVQKHFSEVAPAVVWIAVIIASPRWVVVTLIVSAAGYLVGLAFQGHTIAWMFVGPGRDQVVNQLIDLIANAGVVALFVALLKRFLRNIPAELALARDGFGVLTPRLNAAVRSQPAGLLGRGNALLIVGALSDRERQLLGLLAGGLAPKQAAIELHLSLAAVRTRIANAKRKTGARTLEQLIALYAEASDGI